MRLLIATNNPGKLHEFAAALAPAGFEALGLSAFAPLPPAQESAATFAGNARLKADYYFERLGLPALADDSGLEVAALEGRPGVLSARWGADDRERIEKVLHQLDEALSAGPGDRSARFVCSLCLRLPDRRIEAFGTVEGTIADAPCGSGGFGYDPIFRCPPLGRTFAEIGTEQKNRISHRAVALRRLIAKLNDSTTRQLNGEAAAEPRRSQS